MKKNIVLFILFVLPVVAYLFFASGVNGFITLPTITKTIPDVNQQWKSLNGEKITLQNKITILWFLGSNANNHKDEILNLYDVIYKKYEDFKDFQVVMILTKGSENQVKKLNKFKGWKFIFADPNQIKQYFNQLKLVGKLDSNLSSSNVFIIDKNRNLRGRKGSDQKGTPEYMEGYNSISQSELKNNMMDDIKIIAYEYRSAFKRNNNSSKGIILKNKNND